jgi:hypothetical protein
MKLAMHLIVRFTTSCLFLVLSLLQATQGTEPLERESRDVVGWTLHIDRRLLDEHKEATDQAVKLLTTQLEEIVRVVPAKAVNELRKVPLYFSPEYPKSGARAEYHPGAEWLRDNGRDPVMVKSVEFTNILIFEEVH